MPQQNDVSVSHRIVVVDKETNTDLAASRSGRRRLPATLQEHAGAAALRNSAIRRSQTFSPSGKVVPQIHKVIHSMDFVFYIWDFLFWILSWVMFATLALSFGFGFHS